MAEWPNASVLKTEVLRGTVGSNPTSSDFYLKKTKDENPKRVRFERSERGLRKQSGRKARRR